MTYAEQLKDPRWQNKRKEILRRDSLKCVCCFATKVKLNVHHGIYFKDKMAWEYDNNYLHTLCEPCHERTHLFITSIEDKLGKINPLMLWDIDIVLMAMDYGRSHELLELSTKIIREHQ
jgi:hypothetical protein